MLRQASKKGIKLPRSFVSETQKASKQDEDSVLVAKRASKQTKRHVFAGMKQNCEQRMKTLYQTHIKESKLQSCSGQSNETGAAVEQEATGVTIKEKEKHRKVKGKDTVNREESDRTDKDNDESCGRSDEGQGKDTTVQRKEDNETHNEEDYDKPDIGKDKHERREEEEVGREDNGTEEDHDTLCSVEDNAKDSEIVTEHDQLDAGKESAPNSVFIIAEEIPPVVINKRRRNKPKSLLSSPVSDVSFASTTTRFRLMEEKVARLVRELAVEKKKARIAEEKSRLLQEKLASFQTSFQQFATSVKKITDSSEAVDEKHTFQSPRVSKWVESTIPYCSPGEKSPAVRCLKFNDKASSPNKSPDKQVLKSPVKSVSSVKSIGPAKSPKLKPDKGPNELTSEKLAPAILKELQQGGGELRRDGSGKVHLGNNVWLVGQTWKEVFLESSKKLSILTKDLTQSCLGLDGCKKYSLTGSKSPNCSSNVAPKEPIPRRILEVLYAFYRAKLMQEGITSESVISQSMGLAKKYITEKLHDASGVQSQGVPFPWDTTPMVSIPMGYLSNGTPLPWGPAPWGPAPWVLPHGVLPHGVLPYGVLPHGIPSPWGAIPMTKNPCVRSGHSP
ncbi:hypothetical protein ONE63_011332 [Megalurothrips usitatus]|uniref:Uncharacterized protein n=1 Tax=Megalurothrips usitatus TaxID=439358 RepID=A0AAV7X618_9NEOP|nr:hypothetical protein ONE63_011332 [Megalurothrips usitatus]